VARRAAWSRGHPTPGRRGVSDPELATTGLDTGRSLDRASVSRAALSRPPGSSVGATVGNVVVGARANASSRRLTTRCDRSVAGDLRQSEPRHVRVNALERADRVRLMPDADVAGCPHEPVELLPARDVALLGVASEAVQIVEGLPVLHHGRTDPDHPVVAAEIAALRIRRQLGHHLRHAAEYRDPSMDLPRSVDPHSDEEHDELPVVIGRVASGEDLCHWLPLS